MFIAVIAVYTIAESSSAPLNDADFFTVTFFPLAEFKGKNQKYVKHLFLLSKDYE